MLVCKLDVGVQMPSQSDQEIPLPAHVSQTHMIKTSRYIWILTAAKVNGKETCAPEVYDASARSDGAATAQGKLVTARIIDRMVDEEMVTASAGREQS